MQVVETFPGGRQGLFLSQIVNIMSPDDLVTQGARAWAARLLTLFSLNIPVSASEVSTHWSWVMHICISNLNIIGSDNGLSPGLRQAIIWTNAGILLIGLSGTNFSEMFIKIHTFSFKKMHLKRSPGKWRPFCLSLNVLTSNTKSQYVWWDCRGASLCNDKLKSFCLNFWNEISISHTKNPQGHWTFQRWL